MKPEEDVDGSTQQQRRRRRRPRYRPSCLHETLKTAAGVAGNILGKEVQR